MFYILFYILYTNLFLQLRFAEILSGAYALAMMIVVVGLGLNLRLEGLCSPTAVFLFFLLGVFIISALLHPQVSSVLYPYKN